MADTTLSDAALSILAFAAYHSLVSGETVTRVVLDDGNGHHADARGVEEMTAAGLLDADGERGVLTETGRARLGQILEAIRSGAA